MKFKLNWRIDLRLIQGISELKSSAGRDENILPLATE